MDNTSRQCRHDRRHAFTLVELLVVIGIIALLISILMPALTKARKSAQAVACASNLRQLGVGFRMYAEEWRGQLPSEEYNYPTYRLAWAELINKYLLRTEGKEPGRDYLRCELLTRGTQDYDASVLHTYGTNHIMVFSADDINPKAWYAPGTKKLSKLKSDHWLAADAVGAYIYPPWIYGLAVDMDKDGVPDSSALIGWEPMYNRLDARHSKAANMLYADGHVTPTSVAAWVGNANNLWNPVD